MPIKFRGKQILASLKRSKPAGVLAMGRVLLKESKPFMPNDTGKLKRSARVEVKRGEAILSNDVDYADRHYAAKGKPLRHVFDGTRLPERLRSIFPGTYAQAYAAANFGGLMEAARFGPKRKGLAWFHRPLRQQGVKTRMIAAYTKQVKL